MSLFNLLTNVTKAAVAVAASPVALVVDVVTLPASAIDGDDAFGRTGRMLGAASDAMKEAVKPDRSTP